MCGIGTSRMFENCNVVELKECLACGSNNLKLILDLHDQPLANSYKLSKNEVQETFPLAINHCENCHHVQLTHAVNPDLMFKDYLYVSGTSKTMDEHFKWFAQYSREYFEFANNGLKPISVMDIGCNDGSQLDKYENIRTYGIDPAENLYAQSSKNHEVYLAYFSPEFLKKRREVNYDILVAQNVFAHNYDPLSFLQTAKEIMLDSSLLFIQTSQADMIKNNEFDTIYHEHISFYNINSMNELCKRVGLNLIDVTKCPLHGNSYIFVIGKNFNRNYNVQNHIDMERRIGLFNDVTYTRYANKCNAVVEKLKDEIYYCKKVGYVIVGYGAAAKGMTLLNYSGVNMDFIVDDNPLKQGRFTPGSSISIVSSEKIKEIADDKPILFVPLAWNFFEEIKRKIKTIRNNDIDKFLTYFPEVKITE